MKVMLAEDSTPLRGIIKQMLGKLGYDDVVEASDGAEAWEQLRQEPFDLLLTDWNMPRMSGLELLQRVRQTPQFAYLPVVMLTTRSNKQDIVSAIKAGVNNYVTKPCKPSQLKEKIDKAIRQQAEKRVQKSGLAERIIRDCRKYRPTQNGPYVLFYEAPIDVQGIAQGKDPELERFYGGILEAIGALNSAYPGLEVGYSIENDTKEVTRLIKSPQEQVKVLMISARSPEGFSLARMTGFTQTEELPVYLLCDSIAGLSSDQRDGAARLRVEMMERRELDAAKLKPLFDKYLVPDVRATASGLKYMDLIKGSGPQPQNGQQVTVHYSGMLENGTVFDNTAERGEPFEFTLGEGIVIDGWEEGIAMMNQGGRALLVIPPELGYGEAGDGRVIPPSATLVFNVELVDIGDPAADKKEQMVE